MKIHGTIIAALLSFTHHLSGETPPGYYDSAEGKTGPGLRAQLNQIIGGHKILPYSSTDEAMSEIDADPTDNSNVILIYSRRSDLISDCCSNGWNREHLWPNSYGIDNKGPAYSDIHALRPCDMNVNSSRGNKHFDESDTSSSSYRFPSHPESILCSSDNNSWSPPESLKGDIARAMFYMDIRYDGLNGEPDLELTDQIQEITTSNSKMGSLSTLLLWHLTDPVSEEEKLRNEGVYRFQGNRNPFIDKPQWVHLIWFPPLKISVSKEGLFVKVSWPAGVPRTMIEISYDLIQWRPLQSQATLSEGWMATTTQTFEQPKIFFRLKVQ